MEKYERLQKMKPTDFKRLVGVKKETMEELKFKYEQLMEEDN